MITAFTYDTVRKELIKLEKWVQDLMPSGHFIFIGCDNEAIYFNVVSKNPTAEEMDVIRTKTYFQALEIIEKSALSPYIARFKAQLNF